MEPIIVGEYRVVAIGEVTIVTRVSGRPPVHGLRVHPTLDAGEMPYQTAQAEPAGFRRPLGVVARDEHHDAPRTLVYTVQMVQELAHGVSCHCEKTTRRPVYMYEPLGPTPDRREYR